MFKLKKKQKKTIRLLVHLSQKMVPNDLIDVRSKKVFDVGFRMTFRCLNF